MEKNPKSVWWNNEIKAMVRRKEAAWKEVLVASHEEAKETCMEAYRDERRKVKKFKYQSKRKVNEQLGRKINEHVNGYKKLFWKEVSNAKGGKVEICRRIKDGNGRLEQEEEEVRRIRKQYFEDLYNINTQEQVPVHMCGFDGVLRTSYFRGKPERGLR